MTINNNEPTRVLLVDDDTTILRTLSRVLVDHNFEIETAICAAEARVILSRYPIDAIVCDQKMPGLTGLEFLAEVRQSYPDLVIMMLSGHISGISIAEAWAKEIGVAKVFSKPCDANEIAAAIKNCHQVPS